MRINHFYQNGDRTILVIIEASMENDCEARQVLKLLKYLASRQKNESSSCFISTLLAVSPIP